jgi:hypothetical protein
MTEGMQKLACEIKADNAIPQQIGPYNTIPD